MPRLVDEWLVLLGDTPPLTYVSPLEQFCTFMWVMHMILAGNVRFIAISVVAFYFLFVVNHEVQEAHLQSVQLILVQELFRHIS